MNKFLKDLIKKKKSKIKELRSKIEEATTVDEVKKLQKEVEAETEEMRSAEEQLKALEARGNSDNATENPEENETEETTAEGRSAFDPSKARAVGSTENRSSKHSEEVDEELEKRSSMEYRKAFMKYFQTGNMSEVLQQRDSDAGSSENLGVLIPQTVVNQIIEGVKKVYGQLYSKVTKTNIRGGVKVPKGSFTAVFKRIEEKKVSDRQNGGGVDGYIQFGYLVGEIRIARTILQYILDVGVFEERLSRLIVEAYVKQCDYEIMHGNGTTEFQGIITEAKKESGSVIPAENIIEFTADEVKDWTKWHKKLFKKIPLSMRKERPEFVMTANTFESNIITMKDNNGVPLYAKDPIGTVQGDTEGKFNSRRVTFVENDIVSDFDDAANGDIFGMYWAPSKAYGINENLQFSVIRYFDNETNQYVDKAIVVNDGKILDASYIYLLKKKVAA